MEVTNSNTKTLAQIRLAQQAAQMEQNHWLVELHLPCKSQ